MWDNEAHITVLGFEFVFIFIARRDNIRAQPTFAVGCSRISQLLLRSRSSRSRTFRS